MDTKLVHVSVTAAMGVIRNPEMVYDALATRNWRNNPKILDYKIPNHQWNKHKIEKENVKRMRENVGVNCYGLLNDRAQPVIIFTFP